jgi:hypothetical protein
MAERAGTDVAQGDRDISLNCFGCGKEVVLPYVGNRRVSIKPIEGWTGPPLLCPECSEHGKRSGATDG